MIQIYLKDVKIAYSKFNTGSQFNPGDPIRYKGSLIIEKNSLAHAEILKGFDSLFKAYNLPADKAATLKANIFKTNPEYAEKQTDMAPEDALYFWMSSSFRPAITSFIKGELKKLPSGDAASLKEEKLEDVDPHLVVYGGDKVMVQIKLEYFSHYNNIGVWPVSIHIIKHNEAKFGSAEWTAMLEEAKAEHDQANPPVDVETDKPTVDKVGYQVNKPQGQAKFNIKQSN